MPLFIYIPLTQYCSDETRVEAMVSKAQSVTVSKKARLESGFIVGKTGKQTFLAWNLRKATALWRRWCVPQNWESKTSLPMRFEIILTLNNAVSESVVPKLFWISGIKPVILIHRQDTWNSETSDACDFERRKHNGARKGDQDHPISE